MSKKIKVATASLAGCFGCHMSFLDIDERLVDLIDAVEFNRSPLTDIKAVGQCDVGIIEGGVANAENVEVLREFRENCTVLVATGACAITGGIPALRNRFDLRECLAESYIDGLGVTKDPRIPNDPEIPPLLDMVFPLSEVTKIDYFLPGCPPSADAIWTFLQQFIAGEPQLFPATHIRYD